MLNVAYIGFGLSVKRYHLPYVRRRSDYINIKYIYRRKEDVEIEGKDEEKWYPDICFTTDLQQVINDKEVNLVVINTPNKFHVEYTRMMLNAGKNVLCEKPLAQSVNEAEEMFELAKEKGLLLMTNQNRRYDADMLTVKKVIESGKLGDIVEFESHYDYYNINRALTEGFKFVEGIGIHPIDQVIGQFGIPERLVYDCRSIDLPGKADSYWDIDFFYPYGMKAIVKTSMYVKLDYPRFIVHGKKGSFLMPSLGHQSSAKTKPGPVEISFDPLPESTWGTLCYVDENGNDVTEKVPTEIGDYGFIYDNIRDVLEKGTEKVIKDEETIEVLKIVKTAEQIARCAK